MYIYELPFQINKELCRFLDNDDNWKDLAGRMNYSAFDVYGARLCPRQVEREANKHCLTILYWKHFAAFSGLPLQEIEQNAKRQSTSPTNYLFLRWGQLNHRAEELFMLLYRMKHFPAMLCLAPVLDTKYQKFLMKHESCHGMAHRNTALLEDNAKRQKPVSRKSESIPLPVMLIEKKGQQMEECKLISLPASNSPKGHSPSNGTTSDMSTDNSSTGGKVDKMNELLQNVNAIPMISYDDLRQATNNWADSNLLGKGGFGQVFKGEWKLLPVAVKRLLGQDEQHKELIRELCPNTYRHINILWLYGYSIGGPETCLVYQLMEGGSLDKRLKSETNPMTWAQRFRVAQGVARGLVYLHTMNGAPLIHGDIKPANILLDTCLMPKIGDFGLARKGAYGNDRHMKVSRVHGTCAYLPQEYLAQRRLSPAVDVFSFGVVLLELASARPPAARARTPPLLAHFVHNYDKEGKDLATLEDVKLKMIQNSCPELCRNFIRIGLDCTNASSTDRPTMQEVYKRLDLLEVPGRDIVQT